MKNEQLFSKVNSLVPRSLILENIVVLKKRKIPQVNDNYFA